MAVVFFPPNLSPYVVDPVRHSNKIIDFYPADILKAVGGEEGMKGIQKIEEDDKPDFGINLFDYCNSLPKKKEPYLIRGVDRGERPFILIVTPNYQGQVLHVYSTCRHGEFTNINNWRLAQVDRLEVGALRRNEREWARIWNNTCLEVLSQIVQGKKPSMDKLYQ